MKQVKKMSNKMMKTERSTATGTYRMWRSGGDVIIQLEPKIGGESVVGWKYTVGRMTDCGVETWNCREPTKTWVLNASWSKTTGDTTFSREFHTIPKVRASSTKAALNEFVNEYDQLFFAAILEYEGEVFNPITMETRLHYKSGWNTPLEETWIRIIDDEQKLRNLWDDSFKALAGAVLPIKAWDMRTNEERPQRSIRAIIDLKHTAPLGLDSGVGLPPHCWEIITVDDPDHPDNQYQSLERISVFEPAAETVDLLRSGRVRWITDDDWNSVLPDDEPDDETDWRVESEQFSEHTTYYMIGFDRFEFNPTMDDGTYSYDMTCLELIQEGLMKALLDVQKRISQQARDDVKEASE